MIVELVLVTDNEYHKFVVLKDKLDEFMEEEETKIDFDIDKYEFKPFYLHEDQYYEEI